MVDFDALDEYLGHDHNINFWSDDGIGEAASMIEKLSTDEMARLEQVWPNRSTDWQQRCAQILPHGDPTTAIAILLGMLESESADVRLYAADSLRDMKLDELSDAELAWTKSYALRALADSTGRIEGITLKLLFDTVDHADRARTAQG